MITTTNGILFAQLGADASARDVEAFREDFGRAFLKLELDPLPGQPLQCDLAIRALPDVAISSGNTSAIRGHHPAHMSDADDFILVALPRGRIAMQPGDDLVVGPGEAVLTRSDETNTFVSGATRVINLRFDRRMLVPLVESADDAVGAPIAASAGALRLLVHYAETLTDPTVALDDETLRVASGNLYDLMALTLGRARDPGAHQHGVRAARLSAVKSAMQDSFREPMGIAEMARRYRISPGYLRQLFAAEGTSFSDYLLGIRLGAAHRQLRDARLDSKPVSAIAYDAGFNDLSYFNRCFRRRYGMTPSDVREAARLRRL